MKVGVIGAGTMGAGIAQTFATAGHDVTMVDVGAAQLERGLRTIDGSLAKLEEKKKLPALASEIRARLRTATDIGALKDSDLVVEAAFEDPKVKGDLFAKLDTVAPMQAICAASCNTPRRSERRPSLPRTSSGTRLRAEGFASGIGSLSAVLTATSANITPPRSSIIAPRNSC